MDVRSIFVFLFWCVSGAMIGSTLKHPDDMSIEDTVIHLRQKISQMEEKMSTIEKTETSNLVQKLFVRVEDAEKRMFQDKNQLVERFQEIETKAKDARNDLSAELHEVEERSLKREGEIIKKISEVEMRWVESATAVSARLEDAEVKFLRMDTHLLVEVQNGQEKYSESMERVRSLEQYVVPTLEAKTDILQVKLNETRDMLNSFVAAHSDTENVIRRNISSTSEKLMHLNDSLSSTFENLTTKMRNFENSLLEIEKDYANVSFVSKLDQSLRHLDKDIKTEIQSIQSALSPRVKQLEERCALSEDVAQLNRTLSNHTSQIAALNTDLLDIHNGCPDIPNIINGYPVLSNYGIQDTKYGAIVTYVCRGNRSLVGSEVIVCFSREWTGILPECMDSCNTEDLKGYDGLDIPVNSIIEHSKSPDIRCRPGYVIDSTSETITCHNGTWPIRGDPCMKDSCEGEPPATWNGKVVDFERKLGSTVLYECDRSFVMSQNSTVRCHRGNWVGQPPVCSFMDATFYLRTSTRVYSIFCYSDYNHRKIIFSRVFSNGSVSHIRWNSRIRRRYAFQQLSSVGDKMVPENFGFFQCGFSDEQGSMNIQVQKQDVDGDLYFVEPSKSVSIGDAVELEVKFNMAKEIRWRHNGTEVPSWDNKERVQIPIVQQTDAGIYECYYVGERGRTPPALLRLIVRKCKKNLFGTHCDQQCPPCYNGGICHDYLGVCVCPPGFKGNNCEFACGEGHHGTDCSRQCYNSCIGSLFCQSDPYGCSCAPGWKGINCEETCDVGWYGPNCKQTCHCADGPQHCVMFTGACSGGCSPGWTGESCQIPVVD